MTTVKDAGSLRERQYFSSGSGPQLLEPMPPMRQSSDNTVLSSAFSSKVCSALSSASAV